MKPMKFAALVASLALAVMLVACGGPTSYSQELLTEAVGIKVTAENADSSQTATTEGALVVNEGDTVVISPFTEKGSFHLTITSEDGKTVAYDDDASGKILYTIGIDPGTYTVTTSGNNVTGWMTVAVHSQEELAMQEQSLNEALEEADIDPNEFIPEDAGQE